MERPLLRPELLPLPLELLRVPELRPSDFVAEAFLLLAFPELREFDPLERALLPLGAPEDAVLPGS